MTEEEINKLALEAYPIDNFIDDNGNIDTSIDFNSYERDVYIDGLTKAASLLYSEDDIRDAWDDGSWNIEDGDRIKNRELYIQSLKQQI